MEKENKERTLMDTILKSQAKQEQAKAEKSKESDHTDVRRISEMVPMKAK